MIFHATAPMEYRCHPYAIFWKTRGWDCWVMSRNRSKCLGREMTLSEGIKACEEDELKRSLEAVSIK